MAEPDIQSKAMDVLINLHTAIKNVQLYPPASPTIASSIDRLYSLLLDFLNYESPFVFSESEKKAILRGKLLNPRDQEAIHVAVILDTLIHLAIKSIYFDKGLEKEELKNFIRLMAQKPETILNEGGMHRLMEVDHFVHIYIDENVYAAMKKERDARFRDLPMPDQTTGNQDDIVSHLMERMFSDDPATRTLAAEALVGIIEPLPAIQQRDLIRILSRQLVQWIEQETNVSLAYKKICQGLQSLIQDLLARERFAEASNLMDVFSRINSGELQKSDEIKEISLRVLQNLALEDNFKGLLQGLTSEDKAVQEEAGRALTSFGDTILDKLLDIIRDVNDSNERVRTIHIVLSMGAKAIPAISERINSTAPWYYLRNLAYILGHIGNEQSAHVLQPLLLHSNEKVKTEALKSIIQTGGKQRGALLMSVLPQADDKLRIQIIEMLGKIKYTGAVAELLNMLKNKSSITKDATIPFQEKICNTLGAIGSSEAIPALTEIAESKSFLGLRRSYPVEIKYAAKRALDSIKRKQGEKV